MPRKTLCTTCGQPREGLRCMSCTRSVVKDKIVYVNWANVKEDEVLCEPCFLLLALMPEQPALPAMVS